MKKDNKLITTGNLWKVILILSLPVIFNNIVLELYQIIDTFFGQSLGDNGLAAVSFVGPIIGVVNAFAMAIGIAGTSLVARQIGRKDINNAKRNIGQIITFTIILSLIISVLGTIFSYQIIKGLNAAPEYIDLANTYFKLNMMIIPLKFLGDIYFSYKAARGENFSTMMVSLGAMVIKLILSAVFIYTLDLGVYGLIAATSLSYLFTALFGFFEIFIRKSEFKLKLGELKLTKNIFLPFVIMLFPLLIEKGSFNFSHVLVNMLITTFEPHIIASYGLSHRINSLFFAIPNALGAIIITIVAQNLGLGNHKRNSRAILYTILLGFAFSTLSLVLVYSFHEPLVSLFTSNPLEIKHTIEAMQVFSHSIFAWTIMQVAIGVFYASGHTHIPIIITFSRLFIFRLPVLWAIIEFTNWGPFGIWFAMLFANTMAGIISLIFLLTVNWRQTPRYLQQKEIIE